MVTMPTRRGATVPSESTVAIAVSADVHSTPRGVVTGSPTDFALRVSLTRSAAVTLSAIKIVGAFGVRASVSALGAFGSVVVSLEHAMTSRNARAAFDGRTAGKPDCMMILTA